MAAQQATAATVAARISCLLVAALTPICLPIPPCPALFAHVRRLMPLLTLAVVGGLVAVAYQLYYAPFMRYK